MATTDERALVLAAIERYGRWTGAREDGTLGDSLVTEREAVDRIEAIFARDLRRFERSGGYKADGALSIVDWARWKARLSAGAAMERG